MSNPNWCLKGCPRCGGDLHVNYDGEYLEKKIWNCLQCGFRHDIVEAPKFEIKQLELLEATK